MPSNFKVELDASTINNESGHLLSTSTSNHLDTYYANHGRHDYLHNEAGQRLRYPPGYTPCYL